eukprot:gene21194-28097_t
MADINVKLAQAFLDISAEYYPERLGLFMVIAAPSLFNVLWTAIKPFVDVKTYNKIRFLPYDATTSSEQAKGSKLRGELAKHLDSKTLEWMMKEMAENRDSKRTSMLEEKSKNIEAIMMRITQIVTPISVVTKAKLPMSKFVPPDISEKGNIRCTPADDAPDYVPPRPSNPPFPGGVQLTPSITPYITLLPLVPGVSNNLYDMTSIHRAASTGELLTQLETAKEAAASMTPSASASKLTDDGSSAQGEGSVKSGGGSLWGRLTSRSSTQGDKSMKGGDGGLRHDCRGSVSLLHRYASCPDLLVPQGTTAATEKP